MKIALSTTDYVRFLDAHELAAEREDSAWTIRRSCAGSVFAGRLR